MQAGEHISRARARELRAEINRAVDAAMLRHGAPIPGDSASAVEARAEFLQGLADLKVRDQQVRGVYVHLHELLGDAGAEPVRLLPDEETLAADLLAALKKA
jgi:hypothetical protein